MLKTKKKKLKSSKIIFPVLSFHFPFTKFISQQPNKATKREKKKTFFFFVFFFFFSRQRNRVSSTPKVIKFLSFPLSLLFPLFYSATKQTIRERKLENNNLLSSLTGIVRKLESKLKVDLSHKLDFIRAQKKESLSFNSQ